MNPAAAAVSYASMIVLVHCHNADGKRFWEKLGFRVRDDLDFWQRTVT